MTTDEVRAHFPHTERGIYMNHAATGPLSTPVIQAMDVYLSERHETRIENFEHFLPVLAEARARIGRLIGSAPERVEFAPNTSYALNVLARGLDWRPGDRVAVPGCEFPANVYPFMNLEALGVEVDFIPDERGTVSLEAVERVLRLETRVLTISWVQFLSGFRADLVEIGRLCRERDVIFCVDAIQGLGALQLDVKEAGIDFLACGGHKWLMAAQGIGFLYLTEALQERIAGPAGWLHGPVDWDHLDRYDLEFHADASRYRLGTMNNVGIASLNAALELREEIGPAWCEAAVMARAAELAEGLEKMGLARYGSRDTRFGSGIVTVEHPNANGLHEALAENGIQTAVRQRMLRISPTYYNTTVEVQRVLDVIDSTLLSL